MEKIPHGYPFSPKSEVTALETYNFYRSHEENKLGFICAHHPEMACVDHIWSQVSTYSPLEAPSIQGQRTTSPGRRKHKQYLRFQQLQCTRRRAVKFWSLLDFCAKSNFILWGWVRVDYGLQILHKSPNTWIWGFIYCLIHLFDLSQPHFSLSPNPRKEIIIFPESLKYLWVKKENTDFTTMVLKPRTYEVLH